MHSRAIWAPPHARHSCLYLQLGNLHLPSFHRRQMEACWDWVRWAVKPAPGQAEASGSQASIGWWGFHGQDDAEWSSCRQTLHRAMALSRPVKASLYRRKSCTDHRRSKRYGRSGFGRTTFWPMTTPTITSTLCACSEFFNRGHRVMSELCRCFVGEMDCVIPSQPHQPPASFTFPKRSSGKTPVLRSFQHA